MARIDRGVSPNQLGLWTLAELFGRRPSVTARRPVMTPPVRGGRYGWIRVVLRMIATKIGLDSRQRTATPTPCQNRPGKVTAINDGSSGQVPRSRQRTLTCGEPRPRRVARDGVEPSNLPLFQPAGLPIGGLRRTKIACH